MSSTFSPGSYVRQGQRGTSPPRSVNVQVAVRCRPLSDREKSHGERSILVCDEARREVQFCAPGALRKNTATSHSTPAASSGKKTFTYDQVYGMDATQEDVYEGLVEPIVDEVLQGYNCTVFAYGQTGTGKTHTMEGRRDDDMVGVAEQRLAANAGIIPRAVKQVFDHLRSLTDEHSVRVSHLELYNEQLADLLGPEELANESLRVYEDSQKGTFVQGLEDVVVRSEDEIFAVLDRSATKRKTAETLMNKYSSRSHSIFSITIHIKESTPEGADLLKVGKLNLVDLAGSENVGRSGAIKGRAREAGNINQSLLTLGRVITALVDRHPHVPYRDSKLTRLLQESLGGRNKTCVIATVTPASSSFEETASTLDYAHRAKSIKNRPTVNQMIAKHVLLKEYTEEISKLKRELDATRAKNGVYLPPEEFGKLQMLGKEQRDAISQLSEQSEEYERKLALVKDRLGKTQEALARDQRILADTRQSLATATVQLNETRQKLQVTSQQREENAILVRNHVTNEQLLHDRGLTLQEDLSVCISDTESLHNRVVVKGELETKNVANLATLKKSVSSGIVALDTVLEKHKLEQQSFVETSKQSLETLAEHLESELDSMTARVEEFSKNLLSRHRENGTEESELITTFEASYAQKSRQISETVAAHADLLENQSGSTLDKCNTIFECFRNSQATVSSIKELIKQFGSSQMDRFDALEREQEKILADMDGRVSECLNRQTVTLHDYVKFNEKESERELEDLKNMKTEIIEKVTSSLDALVQNNLSRVGRRKEHVDLYSEDVLSRVASITDTVKDIRTVHASAFQMARQDMKDRSARRDEELGMHTSQHSKIATDGITLAGSLQKDISNVSTSFQNTSEEVNRELQESRALVTTLREKRADQRDVQLQDWQSRTEAANDMFLTTRRSLCTFTGDKRREAVLSLSSVHDLLLASQQQFKGGLTSVQNAVEGYELLCDIERDNIPIRRTWPSPKRLPRTRNHGDILAELRITKGFGEVPREDFGHLVSALEKDDGAPQVGAVSGTVSSEDSDEVRERVVEDKKPRPSVATPNGATPNGATEHEESSSEQVSTPGSESSIPEQVQNPILSDATNRRPRARSKKKLEHVIKKKPSALPVPRTTRSTARKFG